MKGSIKDMIMINLDCLETASKLVSMCEKYKDQMDMDVIYGRYVIDACSILAVTSLVGNIVKIQANCNDNSLAQSLKNDIISIGGWIPTQF
uniref:hypothetical protein n=1 Tax=Coprococcus catus TaxID=116085 RepID=UPI0022E4FBF1|nr:hypothetical protein [Coprococcus catus]